MSARSSSSFRAVLAVAAVALAAVAAVGPARALNDPEYQRQWGPQLIGAKAAWDAGLFGAGVDIAVIDSGVHLTHQDLQANIGPGIDLVNDDDRAQDDNEHGTHVAGIAAGVIDNGGIVGIAPKARILPVKVLDENFATVGTDVGAGIRWAVDHGAEVINLSLSSAGQSVFGPATQDAVAYAWSKGVICVFAAGNDYVLPSGFADEPAIVVSSTTREDERSNFSNGVGGARWGMAAPGSDIFSTIWVSDDRTDTYASLSGTSMSAPHVAGAAALLRGAGLTPEQTVQRLLDTAKDLGAAGPDSQFGHGRLDVARAVAGLGGSGGGGGPQPAPDPGPSATTAPPTTAGPPTAATPTTARPAGGTRPSPTAPPTVTPSAGGPDAAPTTAPTPTDTTAETAPPVLAAPEVTDTTVGVEIVGPGFRDDDGEEVPMPLLGLASVAALGVAGWAAWFAWRRRTDPAAAQPH